MPEPERIDRRRATLIAYDVCRCALVPSDTARRAATSPGLDAWVRIISTARAAGVPVIYTISVSRADGADVVLLPTDLSAGIAEAAVGEHIDRHEFAQHRRFLI
jgi:nicotinamidase-related amidase